MDDQLDDKLKKRIKEVFDGYDDASAGDGWLRLQEKFPRQRRRRTLLWLWPGAAVLLLFLGLGVWLYHLNNNPQENKRLSNHIKSIKSVQPAFKQNETAAAYQKQAGVKNRGAVSAFYKIIPGNIARPKPAASNPFAAGPKQNQSAIVHAAPVHPPVNPPQAGGVLKLNQIAAAADTSKNTVNPAKTGLLAGAGRKNTPPDTTAATRAAVTKSEPAKTIEDMFAADAGKPPVGLKADRDKKVRFGVYAATYFNYAKGSNNQVNAGAGFTADIALAGNLKLVTGLSVNQNSFAYNNSSGFATAPSAGIPYGYNTPATTYTENASLMGLDIPLDLKYEFNSRTSQVYVLAGVGSGTFINESYAYLSSSGGISNSPQSQKGFNDFYFARTLNMAFGLGYPLGKDQLVIEPFVKYPLQGLGAEQLRFGASGINLKFNFSIKK